MHHCIRPTVCTWGYIHLVQLTLQHILVSTCCPYVPSCTFRSTNSNKDTGFFEMNQQDIAGLNTYMWKWGSLYFFWQFQFFLWESHYSLWAWYIWHLLERPPGHHSAGSGRGGAEDDGAGSSLCWRAAGVAWRDILAISFCIFME